MMKFEKMDNNFVRWENVKVVINAVSPFCIAGVDFNEY